MMEPQEVIEYVPRFDKQLEATTQPPASTTLFFGGVGFGKTLSLGDFVLEEMCNYPRGQMIVAGATMPAMKKATIVNVMDNIRARNVWCEHIEYKNEVHFANGSWFTFQSLEVPEKELEGANIHALAIDEITSCPQKQVFSLCNRVRLWNPNAEVDGWDYSRRILFCGNPPEPGHWLEKFFLKQEGSDVEPLGKLITASTYENKLLKPDYINRLEKMYPPGSFQHKRFMLGMFGIPSEGAVYDGFSPNDHIIDSKDVPMDDMMLWVSAIDLGSGGKTGDPLVYLQAMMDKKGNLYVTDEYYSQEGRTLNQHGAAIRVFYRGGPIACDWDGQQRLEFAHMGLRTVPAHKDIFMGIHAVKARLHSKKLFFVRGKTPNLLREMPFYVWAEGDKLVATEGDHALDALRYIVALCDLPKSL